MPDALFKAKVGSVQWLSVATYMLYTYILVLQYYYCRLQLSMYV